MAKMTQQEALREAQRRWPKSNAFAFEWRLDCEVGYYANSLKPKRFFGHTFEAAFAEADRKEKENNG